MTSVATRDGLLPAAALRLLCDSPDAILILDEHHTVHYANAAAAEFFGRPADSILNQPFGLPVVTEAYSEVNIVRPDAREIIAEMRATPIDLDGVPAYAVTLRDVSGRKQMEGELRQAHKMEALGKLAGGVAHDFNNLLTPILAFSHQLLGDMTPLDPRHRAVSLIRDAANRAALLTGQLLTFSRKRVVRIEKEELNGLLRDISRLLGRIIGENIQLRLILADVPAFVRVDRAQIEQVIVNLAVNARDAMPDGGTLTFEVRVDAGGPGGRPAVMLTVRDTGCGMDKESQRQAFEPFYTTKSVLHGTGLGLSTVHGIVYQAGGTILLHSEPGRGTTFQITLPLADDPPDRVAGDPPRLIAEAPLVSGCAGRILVVEDDAAVAETIAAILEARGYEVQAASDGQAALRILHRAVRSFDAMITDLMMPNVGGLRLTDDARVLHPALPILFVSGYPKSDLPAQYLQDEHCDFLPKPFSPDALVAAVAALLRSGEKSRGTPSVAQQMA